jgi:protein CMS1
MSAESTNTSGLSAKLDKKRKRHAEDSLKIAEAGAASSGNADAPSNKKQKNGKSKKGGKGGKDKGNKPQQDAPPKDTKQTETKGGIDEAIGKMDGRLLADHFMQKAKRHNKQLTAVELSDLSVPGMLRSSVEV